MACCRASRRSANGAAPRWPDRRTRQHVRLSRPANCGLRPSDLQLLAEAGPSRTRLRGLANRADLVVGCVLLAEEALGGRALG
jgi:hypothetical protein